MSKCRCFILDYGELKDSLREDEDFDEYVDELGSHCWYFDMHDVTLPNAPDNHFDRFIFAVFKKNTSIETLTMYAATLRDLSRVKPNLADYDRIKKWEVPYRLAKTEYDALLENTDFHDEDTTTARDKMYELEHPLIRYFGWLYYRREDTPFEEYNDDGCSVPTKR